MRTDRSLTGSHSIRWGDTFLGETCMPGDNMCPGGDMCAWGKCACLGGVGMHAQVGACIEGVCAQKVCVPGGGGGVHATNTPLWTEWQTSFAGGNNFSFMLQVVKLLF